MIEENPQSLDELRVPPALLEGEQLREVVAEGIKEWAISERRMLKQKKERQALIKPNDAQIQAMLGGKIKAFQQVIDKLGG